jgi:hypothetical protein
VDILSELIAIWGVSPAMAVVNQTINTGARSLATIFGSVNVGQSVINLMKDNLKVSFVRALA